MRPFNLDIFEQNSVVQKGNRKSWGDIDAMVGFDPIPALLEANGAARMLHIGRPVSLVLLSNRFLADHPAATRRVLAGYLAAWLYYATHTSVANAWFQKESRLLFDPKILDICASVEPNAQAKSLDDLRPTLSAEDKLVLQQAAQFVHRLNPNLPEIDVTKHIDEGSVKAAMTELKASGWQPGTIKVVE